MSAIVGKTRLLLTTALALLAGMPAALADGQALVLRGARILTMDDSKPEASAIALVDGRIAAVGGPDDVAPFLKGAKVYDLPGTLVLPGFQDSHNHLVWSATESEDIDLSDAADADTLRKAIEPRLASLPEGTWIRGGMWDIAALADATAPMLDAITGDRPAYFASADGHSAWVNPQR